MTNVQMRNVTLALVLWSGYIATWTVITDAGAAMVALWWLAGIFVVGSLWVATLPAGVVAAHREIAVPKEP